MQWHDVASRVADEISAGRWEEGARLPGVRTLARELKCSAGTAARAYAALRDGGVLSGTPRSAFVVSPDGAARARAWERAEGAPAQGVLEATVEHVEAGPGRWEVTLASGPTTLRAHLPLSELPPATGERRSVRLDGDLATLPGESAVPSAGD